MFQIWKFHLLFGKILAIFPLGLGPKFGPKNSLKKSLGTHKWYHMKGLVTRNTHVKYESSISYGSKVMAKVKFLWTDRRTDRWTGWFLYTPQTSFTGGLMTCAGITRCVSETWIPMKTKFIKRKYFKVKNLYQFTTSTRYQCNGIHHKRPEGNNFSYPWSLKGEMKVKDTIHYVTAVDLA